MITDSHSFIIKMLCVFAAFSLFGIYVYSNYQHVESFRARSITFKDPSSGHKWRTARGETKMKDGITLNMGVEVEVGDEWTTIYCTDINGEWIEIVIRTDAIIKIE